MEFGVSQSLARRTFSDGLWNLPAQWLHDQFWLEQGVAIVRPGDPTPPSLGAEVFLLVLPDCGVLCERPDVNELIAATGRIRLVRVDFVEPQADGLRERLIADASGNVLAMRRSYRGLGARRSVLATSDFALAELWRQASDARSGYRAMLQRTPRLETARMRIVGGVFHPWRQRAADACDWLLQVLGRPPKACTLARPAGGNIWLGQRVQIHPQACLVGPLWIGDDCVIGAGAVVIGPKVLLDGSIVNGPLIGGERGDLPVGRELTEEEYYEEEQRSYYVNSPVKALLDRFLALVIVACTLPLYPLIMLLIAIEDGRPFFFAHRREALGGDEFPCVKFRTMRKDAETIKVKLGQKNVADGPQFYIPDDPRVTRIGKFLRATHLDELPQFLNVLAGQMSIVGPRPSPYRENQYCPEWREARLSVRPGITGLWQVCRTRRPGSDFQEWIHFDMLYVSKATLAMDLWIIFVTLFRVFGVHIRRMPKWMGVQIDTSEAGHGHPGAESQPGGPSQLE